MKVRYVVLAFLLALVVGVGVLLVGEEQSTELEAVRVRAVQGDVEAQNSLGWMHELGKGFEQDDERAVYWYREAAEQGHPFAREHLRMMGLR